MAEVLHFYVLMDITSAIDICIYCAIELCQSSISVSIILDTSVHTLLATRLP